MTVRLRLVASRRYRDDSLGVIYQPGEEFCVDEERAAFLERDAPGAFERVKAPEGPPANKAILEAPERKATGDDLTRISGISDARQRKLRLSGIHTYADLAAASVDALTELRGVAEQTANEWKEAAADLNG